ncbi:MAG: hypothetical protein ACM338_12305, partial [Betaproteobacteria bacterium]
MKLVSVPVSAASAICIAIALCLAGSALAATGNVSGIVQSATTSEPLTNGSVSLTINGVPWGSTAPVDGSG